MDGGFGRLDHGWLETKGGMLPASCDGLSGIEVIDDT